MPIRFTIHPQRNVAHIRFIGHISVVETLAEAERFSQQPGARPDLNQILDFTETESFERDYAKLLAMLARLPDHLLRPGHEPYFLYIAPNPVAQEMTGLVLRSMQGLPGPILRIVKDMAEALALLGLPEDALNPG